ncbi:hypothetical protein KSP39_PZI020982 [Platanthera zijinensis]|uniref:Uncharacterized protein n=1 Tax=Platanthera zijinensis TaxID=2320716 RepID=A0AAP0AWK6_9ASPA
MSPGRFHLLNRLRQTVAKVRFLLSFNLRQWLLSASPSSRRRRIPLDSRPSSPGLLDITDISDDLGFYLFGTSSPPMRPSSSLSNTGSSTALSPPPPRIASPPLMKSMSRLPSGSSAASDDINQRADDFIENFYRQLRMERQISLQLRHCNGKDVGSS